MELNHNMNNLIIEGFECNDLINVLQPQITIDEYRSKLGTDDKNVVIAFLLNDKTAAIDLVDFLEGGYDFILDADVSTSEIDAGGYLVFVELQRKSSIVENIIKILSDLRPASKFKVKDWKFRYMKNDNVCPVTTANLKKYVPLSPRKYRQLFNKPIEDIQLAAGITPKSEKTDLTNEQKKLLHGAGLL